MGSSKPFDHRATLVQEVAIMCGDICLGLLVLGLCLTVVSWSLFKVAGLLFGYEWELQLGYDEGALGEWDEVRGG